VPTVFKWEKAQSLHYWVPKEINFPNALLPLLGFLTIIPNMALYGMIRLGWHSEECHFRKGFDSNNF